MYVLKQPQMKHLNNILLKTNKYKFIIIDLQLHCLTETEFEMSSMRLFRCYYGSKDLSDGSFSKKKNTTIPAAFGVD